MFEQYTQTLVAEMPNLKLEGETYPPPRLNQILSNVVFYVRISCLLLLLVGPEALEQYLGIQNPPWIYRWAQENKVRGRRGRFANSANRATDFEGHMTVNPVAKQ